MRRIVGVPFALSLLLLAVWAIRAAPKSTDSLLLAPSYPGIDLQYGNKATPVTAFLYCAEEGMGDTILYGLPRNSYGYAVTSSTISTSYLCNVSNGIVDTASYMDEVYPGEGTGWLKAGESGELRFRGCPCIGMIGYGR
jgi:hypothetical protein